MGDSKKTLTYIDACYFNAKTLNFMKGRISRTEDNIRKSKYIAKLALQYSQTLNTLQKFKKSLKFAYAAYNYSCKAIFETFEACKKQETVLTSRTKRIDNKKTEINKFLLIQKALPTLEAIKHYLYKGKLHKVDMRSALGIKGSPDWISQLSLSEIINITPTRSHEFTSGMGIQAEFTKDYLFYKIALLGISLYFLGIRNRTIGNLDKGYSYCISASKFLANFFSEDCPIFQEIDESLSKMLENPISAKKLKKKMKRNKSMSFSISKFNANNSSFTKFQSVYEKPSPDSLLKMYSKKKVKRNISHSTSYFRDLKKRLVSSELKLNVE
jgi:hypothetical protein